MFLPAVLLSFQRTNIDSLYQASVRLQRDQHHAEARATLRQILKSQPLHHDARVLYARLFAWEGEFARALEQYDSVLRVDNGNRDARYGKAQVLGWSGKLSEGIQMAQSLHDEFPSDIEYALLLGDFKLWTDHPSEALTVYAKALALNKNLIEALRGLARSAVQMNRPEEAVRRYRSVLSALPNDPEARWEILRLSYVSTHEVQLQWWEESITNTSAQRNTVVSAEYYYALSPRWKPFLHVGQSTKFSVIGQQFGAGVYGSPGSGTGVFAQLLVSPHATIIPELDASVELNQQVSGGVEVIGQYRYLSFASAGAHVFSPGVTVYPFDWLWCTPRLYFATSSQSNSSSVTITFFAKPAALTLVRLGLSSGDESFRATTLSEIVSVRSRGILLGIKHRLNRTLAIDALYQYSERQSDTRAQQFNVAFSVLF